MSSNKTTTQDEINGAVALTQWLCVIGPTGAVVQSTGATVTAFGIAQDAADALAPVVIATSGPTKAVAAGAIAKGAQIAPAAAGQVATVAGASSNRVLGYALEAAAGAGSIFDIHLFDDKNRIEP
jgi:hypothetical protein